MQKYVLQLSTFANIDGRLLKVVKFNDYDATTHDHLANPF